MVRAIRDIDDLAGRSADLIITCRACGHQRSVSPLRIIDLFRRRGWSTDWRAAHARFRCRACQSKNVRLGANFYDAALRRQQRAPQLHVVAETLRPGLHPPPPGVSIEIWNRASELERKKLVERARG